MESELRHAALLLPSRWPGGSWWDELYRLATAQHLTIDTLVRDYAEMMRLIWNADTTEQVGVVPTRAVLPPEPLIVMDEIRTPGQGRPQWIQRRRW